MSEAMNRYQRSRLIGALRARNPERYEKGTSVLTPGLLAPPEWVELVKRLTEAVEKFEEQTDWMTGAADEWINHADHWRHQPETLVAELVCMAIRPELDQWMSANPDPDQRDGYVRGFTAEQWSGFLDCVLGSQLACDMIDRAACHALCFVVDETRHDAMHSAFVEVVLGRIGDWVSDPSSRDIWDRHREREAQDAQIVDVVRARLATADDVIDQELGPTGPPGVVGADPEGDGGVS